MVYTREEFATKYSPFINSITQGTGILTGTVIAQAIIESQGKVNGSHRVGGSKLSQIANNYFGIKCHSTWKGKTYSTKTGEFTKSGQYYKEDACFRAYNSVEDSIRDYVAFLKNNQRYTKHGVFQAKTVKAQAQALKNAGYATNPNYASMINGVYSGIKSHISSEIPKKIRATQPITKQDKAISITLVSIGAIGLITILIIILNRNGNK